MPKNTPVESIPVKSELKLDTTIGTDEIVAIRVAEVERFILQKQEELKKQRSAHQKALSKLGEDGCKVGCDISKKIFSAKVGKVLEALKAAGFNVEGSPTYGFESRKVYNKSNDGHRAEHFVFVSLPLVSGSLEKRVSAKAAAKVVTIDKEMKAIREKITEIENEMLQLKEDQRKIPSLERQVRAQLATSIIESADGGESMLKAIRGTTVPGLSFDG